MADTVTDVSKLNGWFKDLHGKFQDLIPEVAKLSGMIGPLVKAHKVGRNFLFPVELSLPQGVTYAAAGAGAFAFEDTIPGEMKEATIDGSQLVVSDILDYESAAKATEEGDGSYGDAGERLIKRMRKAGHKRIELSMWYGQKWLAQIESVSTVGSTRVCVLKTAEWATGVWTGMKGMRVDVYTTNALSTKVGTGATLVVDKVDVANRTLTLSGTDYASILADHYIVPRNSVGKDMAGVDKIVTNTGSMFGISADTYELWAGNAFSCGSAPFTLKKLQDALADAVGKGLDEKATCFISPRTWANLCADQASLRKYDASFSQKATNGFRSLQMFSQNGELEIVPHTVIKEGEAFIMPVDRFLKIGAQDFSFDVPGRGERYFDNATNSSGQALAGYRLMGYAHLAIIHGAPGMCTKVTGIVNS
jgi:hypothetical protein